MTCSVFHECASFMREAATRGLFTRIRLKGSTADAAAGYLVIFEDLRKLLKVRCMRRNPNCSDSELCQAQNNECGLMIHPSTDFGMLLMPFEVRNRPSI